MFSTPTPQSWGAVESILSCPPQMVNRSATNVESGYLLKNAPGPSYSLSWLWFHPGHNPTRTEGTIALLPPLNSATGQNHFFTLRPQGHGSQTGSVLHRKWLCPGGITSGDILLSISGTSRRGNEGKRELSGYFLVEISVVVDLAKTYYLRVKCIYTQLLHSQYKPFQT